MSDKIFLTAGWRKLIMANYIIDPAVLQQYVPAHTELDFFNGNCYISLVGFLFTDVKVKGLSIPWHRTFPEVNLRFYVKHQKNNNWKRGVVFISEIVSKPAITWVANRLYREHYFTLPMKYDWQEGVEELFVSYQWKKKNKWNKLEVTANAIPGALVTGTEEEFITEHFWGYSSKGGGKTVEYNVAHPRWDIYTVKDYTVDCDFTALYGSQFSFLQQEKPASVFLAEGSAVTIFSKKWL